MVLKYNKNSSELELSNYRVGIIIFNWKINRAINKIRKHFKQIDQDKKVQSELDFINVGLSGFQKIFVKEIRKEKLQEINK